MDSENSESADKSGQDKEFKKNGTPKNIDKSHIKSKKRRVYLKDKNAPKPPLNGYIRFLNDARQQYSSRNSRLSFSEINKILANEWNQMPADKKQPYLLAAEQERVKYIEELEAYKKTDAYRDFSVLKSNKINQSMQKEQKLKKVQPSHDNKFKKDQKLKKKQPSHDNKFKKDQELKKEQPSHDNKFKKDQKLKKKQPSHDNKFKKDQELEKEQPSTSSSGGQEFKKGVPSIPNDISNTPPYIQIFSEKFLNFNKARDIELKQFRQKLTVQKEELSVLDKHIENMEDASTKLVAENEQLSAECSKYEQYLIKLRSKLLDAFANTAFPDNIEPPTYENIDTYIINYFKYQTTGTDTDTDPSWITCFKNVLSNLNPS